LDDVGRTAMVFEGFGVDHIHAKLFPMHGTAGMKDWKPIESSVNKYFEKYEGYISSHDHKREDDKILAKLAKRLRVGAISQNLRAIGFYKSQGFEEMNTYLESRI
jgi:hypothetical protein